MDAWKIKSLFGDFLFAKIFKKISKFECEMKSFSKYDNKNFLEIIKLFFKNIKFLKNFEILKKRIFVKISPSYGRGCGEGYTKSADFGASKHASKSL